VLAQQPVEAPEEVIVRAKPLKQYRVEIELARDEMIEILNEANEDLRTQLACTSERPAQ